MALLNSCGCSARTATLPAGCALTYRRMVTSSCPRRARFDPAQFLVPTPRRTVRVESRSGESSFVAGFVLGGVVFGALGFIFAPQISKAILGEDSRLKLPKFLEDELPKDPEATKQDLIEKIAQLNASIDEVAATLKTKDSTTPVANAVEEVLKVA